MSGNGPEPAPRTGTDRAAAPGPDSVEESVYRETEHAGQHGPDAADPPRAAGKPAKDPEQRADQDEDQDQDQDQAHTPDPGPRADLDPDEAADVAETREEARRIKRARTERRSDSDEGVISLDTPD